MLHGSPLVSFVPCYLKNMNLHRGKARIPSHILTALKVESTALKVEKHGIEGRKHGIEGRKHGIEGRKARH